MSGVYFPGRHGEEESPPECSAEKSPHLTIGNTLLARMNKIAFQTRGLFGPTVPTTKNLSFII